MRRSGGDRTVEQDTWQDRFLTVYGCAVVTKSGTFGDTIANLEHTVEDTKNLMVERQDTQRSFARVKRVGSR